ncbi:MAG: hypothetical protein EXS05_11835 [Planctomycetaceae bacterium]|nr:hypothetical protein [Planctomycetaceae bacterium]
MTRARCFALAVLISACPWGAVPGYAQSGPPDGYALEQGDASPAVWQPGNWTCDDCGTGRDPAPYGPARWIQGGFIRAEYLNWNLKDPGDGLLGAPVLGVTDPTQPFPVFTPGGSTLLTFATVPTTYPIALSNNSGIRATVGADLIYGGSIEVGAFFLAKKTSGFDITRFPQIQVSNPFDPSSFLTFTTSLGTSVLDHGQISDHILLYNQLFNVTYASQLWGAEANYIGDFDRDGFLQLNPIIGLRYFQLREKMVQYGEFKDEQIGLPQINTTIESSTFNNLYGGQVGARLEMVTKWISFGLDTKLMLLGNSMVGAVTTNHLRSNNDGIVATNQQLNSFAFGVDVGPNVQLHLAQNFNVRVGYNFIWINHVTRPEDNIYYNGNGLLQPPGIVTRLTNHDWTVQGLSVGAELRF